jgi:hydrogenase-4 component E
MTRRNSFAHFVGYVEEENGVIFLALTIIPLPLLIEISVLLDVLALIIAGGILVTDNVEHTRVEELMG